ncbi:succinoglycan biosynthesis protein exop, partial [Rhizobium ruizarguesonis]
TDGLTGRSLAGAAAGLAMGLAAAFLLRLRRPVADPAREKTPAPQPQAPLPSMPAQDPAPIDEMEVLRSEISGLRDRLRVHALEARQPLR